MIRILTLALAALVIQGPVANDAGTAHPYQPMEDVRILSADDMQGRAPDTEGSARARAYILERFAQIGVSPAATEGFEQPFTFQRRGGGGEARGVNLVGRIDGATAGGPVLLVLAHYDHVGVRNGEVYNGADDNASGVAGLLAVAEAMKAARPAHTIIFAALDAEEMGLRGAYHLVDNMPGGLEPVALVVNLDMISKNDRNELYVAGPSHFPALRPRLEAIAAASPLTLRVGHDQRTDDPRHDWTALSDQYPFHLRGKSWLFFSVEDHDEYHTPADDYETIPEPFFRAAVETVVAAVTALEADLDAISRETGRE